MRTAKTARPGDPASTQLSLPGFEAVPTPTDGLFFAIYPDEAAAARIARLAQTCGAAHALQGRPLAAERLHVTLHYLGGYAGGLPPGVVARALRAAAQVTLPPFEVEFDRIERFRGRRSNRPVVLRGEAGLAGLMRLQQQLGEALAQFRLMGRSRPRYVPHVTLLYDRSEEAGQILEARIEPVGWRVGEFRLIHSLIGRTRHEVLAHWPLHPA